jgi:predicted RNA-binding Zn ribbon-like protein
LSRLLAIAYDSMQTGEWERLKACKSDSCHWAFYDHFRNRSGRWCEMGVCGRWEKLRTYRRRHKGGGES